MIARDPWHRIAASARVIHEAERIFGRERYAIWKRTDRLVGIMMCLQWSAAMVATVIIVPSSGLQHLVPSALHNAIYAGGTISVIAVLFAMLRPGKKYTRHVIAISQMMISGMLVYLRGDSFETQFHMFGSLVFLAYYLDWRVLLTGTASAVLQLVVTLNDPMLVTSHLGERFFWLAFFDLILIVSCVRSVTALRASAVREAEQDVLIHQAYHDALTGLGNRLQLERTLANLDTISCSRPLAFMAIDLDRFKEVNDSLGHHIGDDVLKQASQRLVNQLRQGDTLIRVGGDEFAAVVDNCPDVGTARAIAQRLLDTLNQPFLCDSHTIRIGGSIGLCMHDGAQMVDPRLFEYADVALYKAKNAGRNTYVVFDDSMRAACVRQVSLVHRFRVAVKGQKLQPQYRQCRDKYNVVTGHEASIIWADAMYGTIPMEEIAMLGEKTALAAVVGRSLLEQACTQTVLWNRRGSRRLSITVRIVGEHLVRSDFFDEVSSILAATGLDPDLLNLQIAEQVLIDHGGSCRNTLIYLGKLGVNLSVIEFGSNLAFLGHLSGLPITTFQLHDRVVDSLENSTSMRLVVKELLRLARVERRRVVADSRGSSDLSRLLTELGCDTVLGT